MLPFANSLSYQRVLMLMRIQYASPLAAPDHRAARIDFCRDTDRSLVENRARVLPYRSF